MPQYFKLSKYHWSIITLYIFSIPFILVLIPGVLRYDLTHGLLGFFTVLGVTLLYYLSLWKRNDPSHLKLSEILLALVYSLLFAIPEEIIFRGIIQGFLQVHFTNAVLVVLLSSLIFGLAHLPNGARSFHLADWNYSLAALAFLAGLPLGFLFALTGSLLFPTLLHTLLVIGLQLQTKDDEA